MTAKVVFLLLSNRIFWNGFVNGNQPTRNLLRAIFVEVLKAAAEPRMLNNLSWPQLSITNCMCTPMWAGALEYTQGV